MSVALKKQTFSIFIVAKLEIGNLNTYYTYYVNYKCSFFGKLKLDLPLLLTQTGRENFAMSKSLQTLLNTNLCENYHPH